MAEALRPRIWGTVAFMSAAALIVLAGFSSDYVSTLSAEQARLNARVHALENRPPTPPTQVTVTPSPSEPSPTASQSPDNDPPASGGGGPLVAAPGGREPDSRSPRDPVTGGSPPDTPPPIAAPPAESEPECPAAQLLSLCVKASILSTQDSAE